MLFILSFLSSSNRPETAATYPIVHDEHRFDPLDEGHPAALRTKGLPALTESDAPRRMQVLWRKVQVLRAARSARNTKKGPVPAERDRAYGKKTKTL